MNIFCKKTRKNTFQLLFEGVLWGAEIYFLFQSSLE